MRGQLSLELLLVLAAAFAFSAALLPPERALAERARFAHVQALQTLSLERAVHAAREAWSAGPGTAITLEIALQAEQTRLAYREKESELSAEFEWKGRRGRQTYRTPPLSVEQTTLAKGRYRLEAAHEGGRVRLTWKAVGLARGWPPPRSEAIPR